MIRVIRPAVAIGADAAIEHELAQLRYAVQRRAYDLFQRRGPRDPAFDDWLDAERQLFHRAPIRLVRHDQGFRLAVLVAGYDPDSLVVRVSERRILIHAPAPSGADLAMGERLLADELQLPLLRAIDLPVGVDHERIEVGVEGAWLVVELPDFHSRPESEPEPILDAAAELRQPRPTPSAEPSAPATPRTDPTPAVPETARMAPTPADRAEPASHPELDPTPQTVQPTPAPAVDPRPSASRPKARQPAGPPPKGNSTGAAARPAKPLAAADRPRPPSAWRSWLTRLRSRRTR